MKVTSETKGQGRGTVVDCLKLTSTYLLIAVGVLLAVTARRAMDGDGFTANIGIAFVACYTLTSTCVVYCHTLFIGSTHHTFTHVCETWQKPLTNV